MQLSDLISVKDSLAPFQVLSPQEIVFIVSTGAN
jgi:hypothetical protein